MLQPWFVKQKQVLPNGIVKLKFAFYVETLPEDDISLVLEKPEQMRLQCNETEIIYTPNDFYWADKCYKSVKIPQNALAIGKNVITAEITYYAITNLEAMYLFGDFGVRLEGQKRVLTNMPSSLKFGDIVTQGLPFYSGKLTYLCKLPDDLPGEIKLAFQELNCACINISGNGQEQLIAFRPYETDVTNLKEGKFIKITAILTRRNTFEPLHQIPVVASHYGPMSFETEGSSFQMSYSLIPQGILTKPVLSYVRGYNLGDYDIKQA